MKRDYKNAAWVVELFNDCVAKGNEYLEAKELDDDRNMRLALKDFGIALGSLSEIVVRYLLYQYDNYEDFGESSSFNCLWEMLCNRSLQPRLKQLGFYCDNERKNTIARYDVRETISNLAKHRGEVALAHDWPIFFDVYDELRRLVRNFVFGDKTDPLELLHTRTGGSEWEEWENIFNAASGFHKNSGYKYILIIDRPRCKNALDLFKIPWSVVLDFDTDTDQPDGLSYKFQHTQMDTLMERYNINDRLVTSSMAIHWVSVAIKDDDGERYADMSLARKVSKKLRNFMESYHKKHSEPAVVVVSMNDERYSRTLKSTANLIYETYENEAAQNESDVRFLLLKNSSVELLLEDERLLKSFDLGIKQLIDGVQKEIADKPVFTGKYLMPAKSEDETFQAEMDSEQCRRLRQYSEPLFLGIEQEETDDSLFKPEDFYRGFSHVTWKMIAEDGVAMTPEILTEWKSKIEDYCDRPGTPRLRLYYKRGMGGTTCLRMLAFAMHKRYPTIIVHTYAKGSTADEIAKLYSLCNKPLLIFVDTNQLYNEEVSKLREELKSRTFSFTMVWLIGYTEYFSPGELPPLKNLTEKDQNHMVEVLKRNVHSDEETRKLNTLDLKILEQKFSEDFSPFLLSMHIFEDDFPGIRSYVENTLRFPELGGAEREQIPILENILFAVALAGWAGFSVDEQSLIGMNMPTLIQRLRRLDSPLSPLISFKMENNGESRFYQLRHYQFSTYILGHFSGGICNKIRFTGLTNRIVQFIKETRGDPSRLENEKTIRLLRRLFINRDWDSSNVVAENDLNQRVYSAVICKMIEEHKEEKQTDGKVDVYDPETDGILRIYSELTRCYPDEIHFHAHLARYYFYTAHDYEKGIQEIDKALEIAEEDPERTQADAALAYHIKGMGFRARVYNSHIRLINKLLGTLGGAGINKEETEVQIRESLKKMEPDVRQANENFVQSEKSGGNNAVYALISACQLHIVIQKLYMEVKKKSTQYGLSALVGNEDFVRNADQLRSKNDELQTCFDFFDEELEFTPQESSMVKKRKNLTLVQDINADVIALTQMSQDAIKFCQQCMADDSILEKAHYRHLIAQMKFDAILDSIETDENQRKLREVISLYEDNIAEKPESGTDIRNWFNAVRRLNCNCDTAIENLESCREKLDRWIDLGNASRDAYLYRYIVRFLMDYENGSLSSSESQRSLKQMEEDIKRYAEMLPTKTTVVFWVGRAGYGLNRLIANSDFHILPSPQNVEALEIMEGKLPERNSFAEYTAYIALCGHNVFFRPTAIRGTVTAANSGAFVNFGIGFSYDGLRSYHDSIRLITKQLIIREHSLGEKVAVRVFNHNKTWVECLIDEENQPVIINKSNLSETFDPENGKWPEQGDILEVVLIEHRKYVLQSDIFAKRDITKEPFRAECI